MAEKVKVLGNGLIKTSADGTEALSLNGTHCSKCGGHFFPQVDRCGVCGSTAVEAVEMGRKGTVYSYTVCHFPPPGGIYQGYIPYTLGVVAMDEGILIPVRLVADDPGSIVTGARVALCLDSWTGAEGETIFCHAYRVVERSS